MSTRSRKRLTRHSLKINPPTKTTMKIQITPVKTPIEGQNFAVQIVVGDNDVISCGFAKTIEQGLLIAGAELAERDMPICDPEIAA